MAPGLQIHTVVSDPFEENTYVVWREGDPSALIVDPGLEPDLILDVLHRHSLTPAVLLCTHGHADHIGGNSALRQHYPEVPIWIGRGDADMLTDPGLNLSRMFGFSVTSPPADRLLDDGATIVAGPLTLEVRDLPGHSPGHVVFVLRDVGPMLVFGGDTLMRGTTGRGDFPGGDLRQLLDNIRKTLLTLPLDTVVYPGHGPVTTVGHEKATNPVLR